MLSLSLSLTLCLAAWGMLQRRGGRQTPYVPQATRTRTPQPLPSPCRLLGCLLCLRLGREGRGAAEQAARGQWGWDCGTGSGSGHVALMSSRSCSRSSCLARPLAGKGGRRGVRGTARGCQFCIIRASSCRNHATNLIKRIFVMSLPNDIIHLIQRVCIGMH